MLWLREDHPRGRDYMATRHFDQVSNVRSSLQQGGWCASTYGSTCRRRQTAASAARLPLDRDSAELISTVFQRQHVLSTRHASTNASAITTTTTKETSVPDRPDETVRLPIFSNIAIKPSKSRAVCNRRSRQALPFTPVCLSRFISTVPSKGRNDEGRTRDGSRRFARILQSQSRR